MRKIILLLIVATAAFTACTIERNNPPTPEQTVQVMKEYILVSGIFSDSFDESDNAAKDADDQLNDGKYGKSGKSGYPIISIEPFDQTTWPKTITVDYGTTNYLCLDNRYRRGKLMITATDFYRNEGSVLTIGFENYYQNDYKVEGSEIITNTGRNNDGFIVHSVEIIDGNITTPENKHLYFEQNSTRTWIEGESTVIQPCDDVYLIDGTQSGISSDSINYNLNVEESLNILVCCKWVRSGILHVDIEDLPVIVIDYGQTDCDNQATVSFGGTDYPIIME